MADFKVIHKDSFKLFNIISNNSDINHNFRKYPIRLFKDKYILFFNFNMFFIVFKNINSHKFSEIIVDFIEKRENNEEDNKNQNEKIKEGKKKIIDILFNKDLNEWLKKIDYEFNEIVSILKLENCTIKIYNKTLMRKVEENQMRNCIIPNINNERNELLNTNIPSNNLIKLVEMQSKINQFYMINMKSKDNNNNISFTDMILEKMNENKLILDECFLLLLLI